MPRYTEEQGQYLAFIYYYTKIHGRSPSEAECKAIWCYATDRASNGVVSRKKQTDCTRLAGQARSIRLLLPRYELPDLE